MHQGNGEKGKKLSEQIEGWTVATGYDVYI